MRPPSVTATELAECCVCEQRVVLDRQHGKRRTASSRHRMRAGTDVHAELHREALGQLAAQANDGRCFVATALWGSADPRTLALRAWRDSWLLKKRWGLAAVRLYYRLSPPIARTVVRRPCLRVLLDFLLSAFANRVDLWRE